MDPILEARINDLVNKSNLDNKIWLYDVRKIDPIIQNGPQCGIVALCMALKSLNVECELDNLMDDAKKLNYTKNGEIFDVDYLLNLARKHYGNQCEISNLETVEDELNLLKCLINSKLVLIAYDCDFNFEPCNKNGLKAHWALISGFMFAMDKNDLPIQSDPNIEETENQRLVYNINELEFKNTEYEEKLHKKFQDNELNLRDSVYVVCKQGKSKHSGLWKLDALIKSNQQLNTVDEIKCNIEDFIRPKDGNIKKTLSSKILVFN